MNITSFEQLKSALQDKAVHHPEWMRCSVVLISDDHGREPTFAKRIFSPNQYKSFASIPAAIRQDEPNVDEIVVVISSSSVTLKEIWVPKGSWNDTEFYVRLTPCIATKPLLTYDTHKSGWAGYRLYLETGSPRYQPFKYDQQQYSKKDLDQCASVFVTMLQNL